MRPDVIPPFVYPGRDGWLFFIGNPKVLSRMYTWKPQALWDLFRWRALIVERIRRARRLGIRYVEFIVPDKITIHREMLDAPFPPGSMSPARRLGWSLPGRMRRENWVDTYGAFRRALAEGDLYYRTDTHWRASGYMLGYRLICRTCGAEPAPHVLSASLHRRPTLMDIANKCAPPIEEEEETHVFARRAKRVSQNELVTFREANPIHVVGTCFGSRVVMRNDAPDIDPRTVVVFGDSHLFFPSGLGPMLAETFREVHLLWSSPIDWGYVERVRPAILVHELSERFLRRRPNDGFDIESFANERLEAARRAEVPASEPVVP